MISIGSNSSVFVPRHSWSWKRVPAIGKRGWRWRTATANSPAGAAQGHGSGPVCVRCGAAGGLAQLQGEIRAQLSAGPKPVPTAAADRGPPAVVLINRGVSPGRATSAVWKVHRNQRAAARNAARRISRGAASRSITSAVRRQRPRIKLMVVSTKAQENGRGLRITSSAERRRRWRRIRGVGCGDKKPVRQSQG